MVNKHIRIPPPPPVSPVEQAAGLIWAVAYATWMHFAYFHNKLDPSRLNAELLYLGIPTVCMILIFGVMRSGGGFAFAILAAVTLLSIDGGANDTQYATRAISLVIYMLAAPLALFPAYARRRDRARHNEED